MDLIWFFRAFWNLNLPTTPPETLPLCVLLTAQTAVHKRRQHAFCMSIIHSTLGEHDDEHEARFFSPRVWSRPDRFSPVTLVSVETAVTLTNTQVVDQIVCTLRNLR